MTAAEQQVITEETFVGFLLERVPEVRPVVDEHFADYDELLLHLLMADLLRYSVAYFHSQATELCGRLLRFVEYSLLYGDARVDNAVSLSFVENIGAFPDETPEFVASWPPGLLDELARQTSQH